MHNKMGENRYRLKMETRDLEYGAWFHALQVVEHEGGQSERFP
jgi:hypothetical protein